MPVLAPPGSRGAREVTKRLRLRPLPAWRQILRVRGCPANASTLEFHHIPLHETVTVQEWVPMTSRAALGWPGEPPGASRTSPADALAAACDVPGWLVIADELPDGLIVADETGQVTVFNAAAARLTGVDPAEALGKDLFGVLPLHDADGRDWWALTDPYHGLHTRTRHPERPLFLADGTEVLVHVRYVREPRRHREVRRLAVGRHG